MIKRLIATLALVFVPIVVAAQTVMPAPYFYAFDASGDVVPSARLCTYETGTTTPATTYSDQGLTTANADPVIMDGAGKAAVFLTAGQTYRFDLYDATGNNSCPNSGALIWTADGIQAIPSTSTALDILGTAGENLAAGDVVYLSNGSGALTAGRWYRADSANNYSSSTAVNVGMVPNSVTSGSVGTIRLAGIVTMPSASLTVGFDYYAGTTGALTSTQPANSRLIGRADTTQTIVLAIQSVTPSTLPLGCQGRITLTTGVAVTTTDVTAATTVYYTPYKGSRCSLYDGTNWQTVSFTEKSLALGTDTTGFNYDLFGYLSSNTLAIERLVWTNDTTRATTLTLVNGMWTKTGDSTRLYLGTYRTTGAGQTEDSFAKRFVWNYFNRVPREMRVLEATDTWNYSTATIRQANGSTANQLAAVIGIAEVSVRIQIMAVAASTATNEIFSVGVGVDVTNAFTTGGLRGRSTSMVANSATPVTASYEAYPAIGYHFFAWLERPSAVGTTTWTGDDGGALVQSGISGWIEG